MERLVLTVYIHVTNGCKNVFLVEKAFIYMCIYIFLFIISPVYVNLCLFFWFCVGEYLKIFYSV